MSTTTPSAVSTGKGKITVYFLAAPEDEEQSKAIKKYLSPVVRNSKIPIEILSDFEIPAGQDINSYKLQLYDADIVLAFISADFINDDQTYIRTQKVIERYNKGETVMLPILVRNCMWKSTPFVNLPLLPKNTQPLNNRQYWNSEDDALTSVVNDIYESINDFNEEEDEIVEHIAEEQLSSLTESRTVAEDIIENISENEISEKAELLIDKNEEVVEEITKAEPVTEKAPAPAPSVKKTPTRKKIAHVNLEVDYRKNYYGRTLMKRGAAFILDQFLTFVPIYFLWIIIEVMTMDDIEVEYEPSDTSLLLFILVYFTVCAVFESSKWKGTFGKRIMKLEITERNGDPVGFFKAFFRNILRFIMPYTYILVVPIIIQIFTFKKYKKLFHDQMSYTVVGERLKQEKRVK
ncbi:RDD family protein [Mariniflexile sp. AS56]|uniref:RDD family protein n=1 Tax=Mariniflexile sp. AS56 TaxID=3063957 RepID=UPI0026EF4C9B|nr:RDD family protein [Mariniflexile sp. AS56]MDO7173313.1 RDD family protein [Mariniflexile sp. AS56]